MSSYSAFVTLRPAWCWLHHGQPRICPFLASAIQFVTCAALTSRELSTSALDGNASSLEFGEPARSVELPDLAARTPQLSHLPHVCPTASLSSTATGNTSDSLPDFVLTAYFCHSFVALEASLLVTRSIVAAPIDQKAESGRVSTQHSRHQPFWSL